MRGSHSPGGKQGSSPFDGPSCSPPKGKRVCKIRTFPSHFYDCTVGQQRMWGSPLDTSRSFNLVLIPTS